MLGRLDTLYKNEEDKNTGKQEGNGAGRTAAKKVSSLGHFFNRLKFFE